MSIFGLNFKSPATDMPGIILTDVDDSVLSYAGELQAYMEARGVRFHKNLRDVHFVNDVCNLNLDECIEMITQFALDDRHFSRLPPEPCAAKIIPQLHDMGWEFVAISACGTDPRLKDMRLSNLKNAFGFNWKALHTVEYTETKADYLRLYKPTYWVEDNRGHAIAGDAVGHRCFLLDRMHNTCPDKPDPRFMRVKDWNEIMEQIVRDTETPPLWWSWSEISQE